MKEMSEEHLLFVDGIAGSENERQKFLWNLQGNSSFWKQLEDTCEQYIEAIETSVGSPMSPDRREMRRAAFMACAAHLFAGLQSLDEPNAQATPDISFELIEEMRDHCDEGAVVSARHAILGSGGVTNEIWAAALSKLLSDRVINIVGRGLLYSLAMAWISARKEEGVHLELIQDVEMRTKEMERSGLIDSLEKLVGDFGSEDETR